MTLHKQRLLIPLQFQFLKVLRFHLNIFLNLICLVNRFRRSGTEIALRHPAVREAAVVSFEDKDGLTKPRAFLVLRDGFSQGPQLIDELKEAVAPVGSYKIPESFRFMDQLPRTTLLKIDRKALRE